MGREPSITTVMQGIDTLFNAQIHQIGRAIKTISYTSSYYFPHSQVTKMTVGLWVVELHLNLTQQQS